MGKLTVSYNNENIINTINDGLFTLTTKGKLMADDVNVMFEDGGGGETTASQKDVNFIDYDGAIRYSYTAREFANLTDLPANPSHSGLTAQGWNWSLADAKAYVAKHGKLWIGQMYITDDGKTRIYIHLEEGRTSPMLGCCPNGTVVVDWGDGSATETLTGTSLTTVKWTQTHNYATAGDYVITLEVTSGTVAFRGTNTSNQWGYLLRYSSGTDVRNSAYRYSIYRVEIGENTTIGVYAFAYCNNLSHVTIPLGATVNAQHAFGYCGLISITIPTGVTSLPGYTLESNYPLASISMPNSLTSLGQCEFDYCYSLRVLTIPDSVASIGTYLMQKCSSLRCVELPEGLESIGSSLFANNPAIQYVNIPNSVTSIGSYAFNLCSGLSNITIPAGVETIGTYAFNSCGSLAKIRFEPTTPPTVSGSNAWTNISTDCVIYVPERTMEAYTSATNYPDPATYKYVSTITIDGDAFLAENGMTWQQWVDSDYNTIGAYIDGDGSVRCHFDDGGDIDPYLRYFENPVDGDDIVAESTSVINFSPKDEDGNDTNWTWF